MSENYDDTYATADWFGPDPSPLLVRFGDIFEPGDRVLDIGVGQGRNALPLARRGVKVTGIDPSQVACDTVTAAAEADDLPVQVIQTGYRSYEPDEPFDAVLCFGLMQMLPATEIQILVKRVEELVRPGGLLFLTAWHAGDPRCDKPGAGWSHSSSRSLVDVSGNNHRFFLYPDEIIGLFPYWKVVHHWEGMGEPHRHGDGPPEQHGNVDVVLSRPEGRVVDVPTVLYGDENLHG